MIICDDVTTLTSETRSCPHGRWTVAEKNEWAERTRRKLLKPYVEDAEGAVDSKKKDIKGLDNYGTSEESI